MRFEYFLVACLFATFVAADYVVNITPSFGPTEKGLYLLSEANKNLGIMGNGTVAHWNIAQWNNPSNFTNNHVTYAPVGTCTVAKPYWAKVGGNGRVCMGPTANSNTYVELAQTGGSNLKCGVEYDLFVQANPSYLPNVNMAMTGNLSSYSSINFAFAVNVAYANIVARCGTFPQCGSSPDFGYLTAALALWNAAAKQTFFYQILLWDSRYNAGCNFPVNPCASARFWFTNTAPTFGIDDTIAYYGASCATPSSGRMAYNLNVLPKILSALSSAPAGMDKTPANWIINGLYIGTGIQGDATTTVIVDSVSLTGEHTGAFGFEEPVESVGAIQLSGILGIVALLALLF